VPGVVDDARITTEIDGTAFAAAKAAAMRAHATQIEVAEPWFALSNQLAQPLFVVEYYELVRGELGERESVRGERVGARETDLFAGTSPARAATEAGVR
jgi:N-acetyl-1-D-myo-inositol-2-amino-2-deoxy-alpha-D-glucopyranoside deacetylase